LDKYGMSVKGIVEAATRAMARKAGAVLTTALETA
jgi:hypothetical protein